MAPILRHSCHAQISRMVVHGGAADGLSRKDGNLQCEHVCAPLGAAASIIMHQKVPAGLDRMEQHEVAWQQHAPMLSLLCILQTVVCCLQLLVVISGFVNMRSRRSISIAEQAKTYTQRRHASCAAGRSPRSIGRNGQEFVDIYMKCSPEWCTTLPRNATHDRARDPARKRGTDEASESTNATKLVIAVATRAIVFGAIDADTCRETEA